MLIWYSSVLLDFFHFRHIYKKWKENPSRKWKDFFHPTLANCVHARWRCSFKFLNANTFFIPNCSKFAVECDWNSKISQNERRNLGFLNKIDGFFSKKNLYCFQNRSMWQFICRMRLKWYYSLKMSFPP